MNKTEYILIGSGQMLSILTASQSVTVIDARVEQVLTPNHLAHRKTNQKDCFWNRGHETC